MFCAICRFARYRVDILHDIVYIETTTGAGKEVKTMTATETARLIEWLIEHGHTAEEATECIKFIAYGK